MLFYASSAELDDRGCAPISRALGNISRPTARHRRSLGLRPAAIPVRASGWGWRGSWMADSASRRNIERAGYLISIEWHRPNQQNRVTVVIIKRSRRSAEKLVW